MSGLNCQCCHERLAEFEVQASVVAADLSCRVHGIHYICGPCKDEIFEDWPKEPMTFVGDPDEPALTAIKTTSHGDSMRVARLLGWRPISRP